MRAGSVAGAGGRPIRARGGERGGVKELLGLLLLLPPPASTRTRWGDRPPPPPPPPPRVLLLSRRRSRPAWPAEARGLGAVGPRPAAVRARGANGRARARARAPRGGGRGGVSEPMMDEGRRPSPPQPSFRAPPLPPARPPGGRARANAPAKPARRPMGTSPLASVRRAGDGARSRAARAGRIRRKVGCTPKKGGGGACGGGGRPRGPGAPAVRRLARRWITTECARRAGLTEQQRARQEESARHRSRSVGERP